MTPTEQELLDQLHDAEFKLADCQADCDELLNTVADLTNENLRLEAELEKVERQRAETLAVLRMALYRTGTPVRTALLLADLCRAETRVKELEAQHA